MKGHDQAARPLLGQSVVVTRAREQASGLAASLRERGAEVLEVPTIKIVPPTNPRVVTEVLTGLNEYDWMVFTSPNGVAAFFEVFFKRFRDMRDVGGAHFAAVGPGTAAKLEALHLQVDAVPEENVAAKIVKAMAKLGSLDNLRVLLLRAEVANPDLPRLFEELGAIVDDVPCYQTVAATEDASGAAARLAESGANWITFTSGSTVEQFHARFNLPELVRRFPETKLASIGPETSKALLALGLKPAIEARPHTIDGLLKALEKAGH